MDAGVSKLQLVLLVGEGGAQRAEGGPITKFDCAMADYSPLSFLSLMSREKDVCNTLVTSWNYSTN